jgi:hypothetical protein
MFLIKSNGLYPMHYYGQNGEAKKTATAITGVFLWHGGPIRVRVGANGGDGGNGGAGSNYMRGGPGGGGLDTIFGSIIAPGAPPTLGGDNKDGVNDSYGKEKKAAAGSVGMGGCGGNGEDDKNINNGSIEYLGGQGYPGKAASDKTNGYARLWRIG